MAIGAHADDVELNFGGTIAKYQALHNYQLIYVQSTNNMSGSWARLLDDGSVDRQNPPWYEIMPQRKLEAANSARESYKTEPIHLNHPQRHYTNKLGEKIDLRYGNPAPDCVLPDTPTIMTAFEDKKSVEKLSSLILDKNPNVILTHGAVDPNPEHTCTAWLVINAFNEAKNSGFTGSLLLCVSRHADRPGKSFARWDTHIDISGYLQHRIDAVRHHACQIPWPEKVHERVIKQGKKLGIEAAETYTVYQLSENADDPLSLELTQNLVSEAK